MAAPSCVLTVIKQFTYRGVASEEWSNTYALSGSTPADSTAWKALFDAMVLQEKTLYTSASKVVRGYGYNRIPVKGDHALWTVDMNVTPNTPVPGTLAGSADYLSGDQAVWIRWGLDRFNTHGKRVYLRKYYHGGMKTTSTTDTVFATLATNLDNFGTKMRDGTFISSRTLVDRLGNAPIGHAYSNYVTTRTLKRRGKRPGS